MARNGFRILYEGLGYDQETVSTTSRTKGLNRANEKWKIFKNKPCKICGRQFLKKLKRWHVLIILYQFFLKAVFSKFTFFILNPLMPGGNKKVTHK